jgi:hypothetical protein
VFRENRDPASRGSRRSRAGHPQSAHARALHCAIAGAALCPRPQSLVESRDHDSVSLFRDLDPVRFRQLNQNPIALLNEIPETRAPGWRACPAQPREFRVSPADLAKVIGARGTRIRDFVGQTWNQQETGKASRGSVSDVSRPFSLMTRGATGRTTHSGWRRPG